VNNLPNQKPYPMVSVSIEYALKKWYILLFRKQDSLSYKFGFFTYIFVENKNLMAMNMRKGICIVAII